MNGSVSVCIEFPEVKDMNQQKRILAVPVLLAAGAIILDGKCALQGASEGMELCLGSVIPALFPFLFLSSVLTGILWGSEPGFLIPLCRRLGIPAGGSSLLISGFLGGYPAGAQSIGEAYRASKIDRQDAARLLGFCNNAGPAFLFGMTAMQFSSPKAVWLLWGIQISGAVLTGLLTSAPCTTRMRLSEKTVSLSGSLRTALMTMGSICGWILLFRILLEFAERWFLWRFSEGIQVLLSGFLELSIGCCQLRLIPSEPIRFVVCSAMLSMGGLCVAMQTASAAHGIPLGGYFRGKLLQTVFSILLALLPEPLLLAVFAAMGLIAVFPVRQKNKDSIPGVSVV